MAGDQQQPFCSDPSYDLEGLHFVDAVMPCPQLVSSVFPGIFLGIVSLFLFGHAKKNDDAVHGHRGGRH